MRRLMDYLPENYPASRETAAFQEALQPEADALWAARDGLLAQLDVISFESKSQSLEEIFLHLYGGEGPHESDAV